MSITIGAQKEIELFLSEGLRKTSVKEFLNKMAHVQNDKHNLLKISAKFERDKILDNAARVIQRFWRRRLQMKIKLSALVSQQVCYESKTKSY